MYSHVYPFLFSNYLFPHSMSEHGTLQIVSLSNEMGVKIDSENDSISGDLVVDAGSRPHGQGR
jgi:hypothetical protein